MASLSENAPANGSPTKECAAAPVGGASLLLDADEAAAALGLSKRAVYQLVRERAIPSVELPSVVRPGQIMRRVRIPRAGLQTYLASITTGGGR